MILEKFLLLASVVFCTYTHGQLWSDLIASQSELLQRDEYHRIIEQYQQYLNNVTQSIAHPRIKEIPIQENYDPLVDLYALCNKRICMMPSPANNQPFASPDCNSGLPSASKMRSQVYARLEQMIIYLDELAPLFGYQVGEISIRVFEGLRDLRTQAQLFDNKVKEISLAFPQLSNDEVEAEAAKWISPVKNNIPVHSTGAAVDVRLWNEKTQQFVDLGAFGAIWSHNLEAPTFSEAISDAQKSNRLFLLMAATKAGLVNYSYEFWHFSYGDKYAAYWLEKDSNKRVACYGAV